ncbi:MAG: TonB-dependent receptor plug domain-containing protein [Bacteroidaceae bacterium]|nr:TonB-dependent receptor plug domain-containing protein [Bacteroidaceae bacterium]
MKEKLLGLFLVFLFFLPSMAQDITGVVLKNGKPKKGINVWLKKADRAMDTDKEGKFYFFDVAEDDTLLITAGTRADAEFPVENMKNITVDLNKKDFVVSDGTKEQRLPYVMLPLPKPSDGVTHEMIMRSGLRSISDILKSYMTGVVVSTDGGTTKVLVHGISSINSSTEPLVVLDGMALQGVDIENLVPVEEIALIKVVKDGSGYGVRGANGVIEITTRK